MPPLLSNFIDALGQPAMRHAMVGHFPIVLSLIGFPIAVWAAIASRNGKAVRLTALVLYGLLAVSSYATSYAGDLAHDAIRGSLDQQTHELLEEHEELGEKVWKFAAGVGVLMVISLARHRTVRMSSSWLAAAGGLFVAGWIVNTADHGGRLVYGHGAGTPQLASAVVQPVSRTQDMDPRVQFFGERIRPILVNNCLRCHNPQRARRAGRLDQTTIAGLLTGGISGPAIIPGRPGESLLMTAVRHEDPDLQMPSGGDKLSEADIAALENWITDGAVWEAFEYVPPVRAQEPDE